MSARFDPFAAAPWLAKDWHRAMLSIAATAALEPELVELVKIRASQINCCANCLNLHVTEARDLGIDNQRLDLLPAWREAPCYSPRERAALGWTEALTRLSQEPEIDGAYETLNEQFEEEEQVRLTILINIINDYNRLSVGFRLFSDPAVIKAAARSAVV